MKKIKNKVAVITGGASGIGYAIADLLSREGCHLAIIDVNKENMEEARSTLKASCMNVSFHICDTSDRGSLEETAKEIFMMHGRIDILVNNAGIVALGKFDDLSYEDLERVININLWGVINGCKTFLPYLKEQSDAHVINMASSAALFAQAGRSVYSLTKAGVSSLSQSLRKEWAPLGIGVTAVYPGIIKTNIGRGTIKKGDILSKLSSPVNKAHSPYLVARKTVKAIIKNKARIFAGQEVYQLDFGMRLMPVKMDSLLNKYL